ncbi:MAG TPA: aminotransferase class V-fold PLP-dependent enzyme [Candidatus Angelobacter sp.]|nr:aminotransferase class V-fold PLP-dependent enzyme [Candidatus Angelobacter sp.]
MAYDSGVARTKCSTGLNLSEVPDAAAIRGDFPALHQNINGFPLVYLDSAATTHRPRAVIDATLNFYEHDNANPSTSLHTLARRSAALYEAARRTVAQFIHARSPDEIIWTRGTTEAINLAASSWGAAYLRPGDEILLTQAEHYSNLLPWQFVAARMGARLRFLEVDADGNLRRDQLEALLSPRTKMVAFSHVSNVLGRINPASEICERAHRAGAMVLIDAAQSVPHIPIDVQTLGCDFLAFSGHKMTGPMGIGVLWARRELLDTLPAYQSGSNMTHELDSVEVPPHLAGGGHRFEAGTPNVAGAVGLAAAIVYLESIGRTELWKREQKLTAYALERLLSVPGLRILGSTAATDRISIFSFVLESFPVPTIIRALDERGIAIRGGDLAALPLLKQMGVTAAARASCYIYTQPSDIDALAECLCDLTPLSS